MGKYDDIINLNYPYESDAPHPMPVHKRAAQFRGFAALRGHAESIEELLRETTEKVELTEDACQELSQRMSVVIAAAPVKVSIKHFVPDPVKSGGAYRVTRGRFLRVDSSRSAVVLAGGVTILLDNIVEIDSPALDKFL